MAQFEPLRKVIEDLIEVMHLQAKELERLVAHVEQLTGHLSYEPQLSLVASELTELHHRVRKLAAPSDPGEPTAPAGTGSAGGGTPP